MKVPFNISKKLFKLALTTSLAFGVVAPSLSLIENESVFAGDVITVEAEKLPKVYGNISDYSFQNLDDGRLLFNNSEVRFDYSGNGPKYNYTYHVKVADDATKEEETIFTYYYANNEGWYTNQKLVGGNKYVATTYPNNYLRKATIIEVNTKKTFDIPLAYNFKSMDINDNYLAYITENDDVYIYDLETKQLVLKKNYYNGDNIILSRDGSPYFAVERSLNQTVHNIDIENEGYGIPIETGKVGMIVDKNTYLFMGNNGEWFKSDLEVAKLDFRNYVPEKINFNTKIDTTHSHRLIEYYNGKVVTGALDIYDVNADDYYNVYYTNLTESRFHDSRGFIALNSQGIYVDENDWWKLPLDMDSLFGPSLGLKYYLDSNKQITLNWGNLENVSSYEVYKNNELVYEGNNTTFVDNTLLPSTNYSYKVAAKDANGEVLTRKTVSFATEIENPKNVTANIDTNGFLNVTWSSKNPTDTEYQVTVKNTNPESTINANVSEGFEDTEYDVDLTGTWVNSTSAKTEGSYALRSSNYTNRSTSYSTVTIDVPANAQDAKASFDYMVSSEPGYDGLYVTVNGTTVINKLTGLSGWRNQVVNLKPGENTIQFSYSKDGSVSKNLDAAFIDNFKYSYTASEDYDSGWINGKSTTFNINNPEDVYEVTVQAKKNGKTSEVITVLSQVGNSVSAEITKGIEDMAVLIETGLESQEQIDNARSQLNTLVELLTQLPEGQEKEELQSQLNDIQDQINLAQDILNATTAVNELESTVSGDLSTQELINSTQEQLDYAQELVNLLPENNEVRIELQTTINEAQEQIDTAQATLNVITAEATPTQGSYDKAIQSLEQVNNEEVKSSLTERLAIVKDVLDANSILDNITGNTFTSLEQIEQAILDLQEAKSIIDRLPSSSIDNPYVGQQKAELESKYAETKQYLGDSLVSLLEGLKGKESKGKPERLTSVVLDFLVQHAINEVNAETLKGDRGKVVSYVASLAGKFTTGAEINKVVEKYLP